MKKIGIITIQKSSNYGACLQCYALYRYIANLGFDCEIIDLHRPGVKHQKYRDSKRFRPYRYSIMKKLICTLRSLFGNNVEDKYPRSSFRMDKIRRFNNQMKYSCPYESPDDLYAMPPKYDVYISGSDQLWNPTMNFCVEPYFLTFAPQGAAKLSYATSIGVSNLKEKEKQDYTKWLSDYTSISVRERSAQQLLSSFVDKTILQVQDPSFLLTKEEWQALCIPPKIDKPYILLYTLEFSESLLQYVCRLKEESNLDVVYLCWRQPIQPIGDYTVERDAGIEEFLGYIQNASIVVTNSFHGTVFSIILGNNNFYSYVGGSKRGSRIVDLLCQFNLNGHLLDDNLCKTYDELCKRKIDYGAVDELICKVRGLSQNYLKQSLLVR